MAHALLIVGYDGSGLGLRAEVELIGEPVEGLQKVHLVHYSPEFHGPEGVDRVVPVGSLQPLGSPVPIASFNWLD